jgi:hypothetical protein
VGEIAEGDEVAVGCRVGEKKVARRSEQGEQIDRGWGNRDSKI